MNLNLKLTLRAFAYNARFALINLIGLAASIAAVLIIGLFILHETDYDRWIPQAADIHMAAATFHVPGRAPASYATVPGPLADIVQQDSAAIEVTRLMPRMTVLRLQDAPAFKKVTFVDDNFFETFAFPVKAGDPVAALGDLRTLVLTEHAAQEMFGSADIMGRVVEVTLEGATYSYRIGAILADFPSNTHFSDQIFAQLDEGTFRDAEPNTFTNWGSANMRIYTRLVAGASVGDFNARIDEQVAHAVGGQFGDTMPEFAIHTRFLNLPNIHMAAGQFPGTGDAAPGNPALMLALGLVALLILAMAMVNYVNLATAITLRRMREIALRRAMGAGRASLVRTSILESVSVAFAAGLLALVIAELSIPFLARIPGIELSGLSVVSGTGLILLIAVIMLTGLLSSIAPTLTMTRFRPAESFAASASRTGGDSSRLRSFFVILQFAASIGLIAATLVIFRQSEHLRTADMHYDRDSMIAIDGFRLKEAQDVRETLVDRLSAAPGIVAFGLASNVPGMDMSSNSEQLVLRSGGERQALSVKRIEVGFGFMEAIETRPLAGRFLSRDIAADGDFVEFGPDGPANIVLNEAAVSAFGFASPEDAIGTELRFSANMKSENVPAHVVGVVPNLRFGSLTEPPRPTYYLHGSWGFQHGIARYRGIEPAEAMERLEAAWRQVLPDTPFSATPVESLLAEHVIQEEAQGRLFGAFALLTVAIAAVGIYGIAAFTAQRRAREMAVRRVFGASTGVLLRTTLMRFSRLVGIGALLGVPVAAFFLSHWLSGYAERIFHGPAPYLLAFTLAILIGLGSVAIEAWRVARTTPVEILRQE